MNTLVRITAILLALTLLTWLVMATTAEEEHGVFIVSTSADDNILYSEYVSSGEHDLIPEHMEHRPFFRDSDPEFVVIDSVETGYPAENVIIAEAMSITSGEVSDNSVPLNTYEYVAVP